MRGVFQRHVLLAVHQLQGRGYAVSIADEVGRRAGKAVNLGAVYGTLDRLEAKGFISSKLGERTPERGGKPKRFYQLTAPGVLALTQARDADTRMWADVSSAGRPA